MFLESSLTLCYYDYMCLVLVWCASFEICNVFNMVSLVLGSSFYCIRKTHIKINRIHTDWSDHVLLNLGVTRNGNETATFYLHIVGSPLLDNSFLYLFYHVSFSLVINFFFIYLREYRFDKEEYFVKNYNL